MPFKDTPGLRRIAVAAIEARDVVRARVLPGHSFATWTVCSTARARSCSSRAATRMTSPRAASLSSNPDRHAQHPALRRGRRRPCGSMCGLVPRGVTVQDMRRLGLFAGIALLALAVPGPGLAAGSPSSSKVMIASPASVAHAFAAHGIPLEQKGSPWPANDKSLALKVLWNRKAAPSQGVVNVQVLRSVAQLRSLPARMLKPDTCAGFPSSYLTVKSRNVIATYTSCVTSASPIHLATDPVLSEFLAAMQSLQ